MHWCIGRVDNERRRQQQRVNISSTKQNKKMYCLSVSALMWSTQDISNQHLVCVELWQRSWWVCRWSECRGTERDGGTTARDFSPGTPSSDRFLQRGNIAAKNKPCHMTQQLSGNKIWMIKFNIFTFNTSDLGLISEKSHLIIRSDTSVFVQGDTNTPDH